MEPLGWTVISSEYVNLDTEMTFKCKEGHTVYSSWKNLRKTLKCPTCENNVYSSLENNIISSKAKKSGSRILALDQATHITGYSIFDGEELIKYGIYEATLSDEIARDNQIKIWLLNMINNWKPDYIAVEGIHYSEKMGVTTLETLARLQGILMEAVFESKIPCYICHSAKWREFSKVKGKSRADKKKSAELIVKSIYDITKSNDVAEAILIRRYFANFVKKEIEVSSWE